MKKIVVASFAVIFISTYPYAAAETAGRTVKVAPNVVSPDSLRIPSSIALLKETSFYSDPEDWLDGEPAGSLAPQEGVKILGGEYTWARGKSWWKISTDLGPKWISPEPWNVDVPPPEKIVLFNDTPIYATTDDTQEPSAILSPQEVQVTGAEKQWFYANGPDEKRWVRIHTSWLGEQWVHLPVAKIGYIKPVDYYSYYGQGQYLLDDPTYNGPYGSMAGPMFKWLGNETAHVTGEFVSVYDTNYQLETETGVKYVHEKGTPIVRGNETITLKADTPLFAAADGSHGVALVLPKQSVSSYEKIPSFNLYHVHTSLGDGWVNPDLAEPTNVVKINTKVEIRGQHTLFRFPSEGLTLGGLHVKDAVVEPSAYWEDPHGTIWYLLETKDGKAWVKKEADLER
ncbi:hypothetical protein [Paenibacillus ferrarius]|uniref:hypothetical protein n=1 Tax=Paenibacillus ferrarius TaxID=1469647 RepID=UPI003D2BDEE3